MVSGRILPSQLTVEGKKFKSLSEAARYYGLAPKTVRERIKSYGWTLEEAFGLSERESPKPSSRTYPSQLTVEGKTFKSLREAARHFSLSPQLVRRRMARGWTAEQALELEKAPVEFHANATQVTLRSGDLTKQYGSVKDAALDYGLAPATVRARIKSLGWTLEEALGLSERESRKPSTGKNVTLLLNGIEYHYESISAAAKAYDLDEFLVFGRLNRNGWSIEQALELSPPPGHTKTCYGYLYLITNCVNGKMYVGQTMRPVEERWKAHIDNSSLREQWGSDSLARALAESGPENFKVEKIDEASTRHELNELERYWIKKHQTLTPNGYNLNRGGAGNNKGEPITVQNIRYASIADAAREFNLSGNLVRDRLRYGWNIEQTFGLLPAPDTQKYVGRTISVEHNGETLTFTSMGELARHFELPAATVRQRIIKLKWTPEQSVGLVKPPKWVHPKHHFKLLVQNEIMGFCSKSEAAAEFGFARWGTVQKRINRGWSTDQALGLESPPFNKFATKNFTLIVDGKELIYGSLSEAARFYGVCVKRVSAKRKLGWSYEEALEIVPR